MKSVFLFVVALVSSGAAAKRVLDRECSDAFYVRVAGALGTESSFIIWKIARENRRLIVHARTAAGALRSLAIDASGDVRAQTVDLDRREGPLLHARINPRTAAELIDYARRKVESDEIAAREILDLLAYLLPEFDVWPVEFSSGA